MKNGCLGKSIVPLRHFSMELANQLIDPKINIEEIKGLATNIR